MNTPFRSRLAALRDLGENLDELASGGQPQEQVAIQLWFLMQKGYPKHRLVLVLLLIQNLEWSTLTAEQQHATAALLMRHHPDYSLDTLLSRSTTNMIFRVLHSRSDDEKLLGKLQLQLDRERSLCPHMTRWHVYDCQGLLCCGEGEVWPSQ